MSLSYGYVIQMTELGTRSGPGGRHIPTGTPIVNLSGLPKAVVRIFGPLGRTMTVGGVFTPDTPSLMPPFIAWQKQPKVGACMAQAYICLASRSNILILTIILELMNDEELQQPFPWPASFSRLQNAYTQHIGWHA